jgi:hypothetical protein
MKLRLLKPALALALALNGGAALAAGKTAKPAARSQRTVCVDPSLRGETGNVCRISCAGFFVDVRSSGTVTLTGRDGAPGRFTTLEGKLNGEGKFTSVSILTSPATACAFSGFDLNGPINPELRR